MNRILNIPKKLFYLLLLPFIFCFGCSMKAGKTVETNNSPAVAENKNSSDNSAGSTNQTSPTNTAANVSNDVKNSADEKDLLSFFSGALIVKKTAEFGSGWTAENAIDEILNPAGQARRMKSATRASSSSCRKKPF